MFSRKIFSDSLIYGLSITEHFKLIKDILIALLPSFDCKCLAQMGWQDWGSGEMPKMLKRSISQ